ncbi:MAG: ABC transporter substrate-binding protein [Candidatus Lokiarchaeota archaeon]
MIYKNRIKSIVIILGIFLIFCTTTLYTSQSAQENIFTNDILTRDIPSSSQAPITLRFGTAAGVQDLDPHNAWDSASVDVIDQVVETLFAYDLSNPELPIIPRLASDYGEWFSDGLIYRVPLLEGVTFHDGTPFNATAVAWNFNRLFNFMTSSELPHPQFTSLYQWADGTPIIDTVQKFEENEYIVEFTLNRPYAPFLSLLCFPGSGIMSRSATPEDEYIDTLSGDLVGTGPFVYDEYIQNVEVRLHSYENYREGQANIDELIFSIIPNPTERTEALLDGIIDYISTPHYSMLQTIRESSDITLFDAGFTTTIFYLGMNNMLIEKGLRKAISYTFNYNEVIEDLTGGEAVRLKSPLPQGILYAKEYKVPETDIEIARLALIEAGIAPPESVSWTEAEWVQKALDNPFRELKFIYWWGSDDLRMNVLYSLQDDLKRIGVSVLAEYVDYSEFLRRAVADKDLLELFWSGWLADYDDPSNYVNSFFADDGGWNLGQVHIDDNFQDLLQMALSDLDPVSREDLYDQIQQILVDEYPFCWGYTPKNYIAYHNRFDGFQPNPLAEEWFYPVYLKDTMPPMVIYDSIPEETTMTYTRSTQVIGTIKAYDTSNIFYVGWQPFVNPDPGFSLITTYNEGKMGVETVFFSETVVMTTELLEPGLHSLDIAITDDNMNSYIKNFRVEVFRLAELKLSGEFDYLEKEKIKISVAAQVFDLEENFLMNPTEEYSFNIHLRILDDNGVVKVEDSMSYDFNGFFHWDSISTINDLKDDFPKGVYTVQAWVEFSENSYYMGGNDVIQFHIDPPGSDEDPG